jgi:hypothetical protein
MTTDRARADVLGERGGSLTRQLAVEVRRKALL